MPNKIDIDVHHITRVEGHGNIRVRANDCSIEQVEWQVPEAPRFFEAMVRGRDFQDIQTIVSRICGICSVTHSLASLKAIESAMDIGVSEQTDKLRMLAHYGEQVESHSLHVGYLVAPDLLGVKSVVPLVASHPDVVKTIIRVHRLGNQWMELIGGRRTHPVSLRVGGMGMIPSESELVELKKDIEERLADVKTIAEVVLSLADKLPDFTRDTEYVALTGPDYYTFYHGDVGTTDSAGTESVQNFEQVVNEYVVDQSTAKWAKWHRDSYAVGALARFNINADKLMPQAKKTAEMFGLAKGCCNPYFNNVAQVVELVQTMEHSLQLIDELLDSGLENEFANPKPKAGNGAGAVEAPRGVLFHRYEFDDKGKCLGGNISIPTNQNHGNIQKDFEALVPQMIDRPQEEIKMALEMLVRSYDPCISCSTHMLNVEFV